MLLQVIHLILTFHHICTFTKNFISLGVYGPQIATSSFSCSSLFVCLICLPMSGWTRIRRFESEPCWHDSICELPHTLFSDVLFTSYNWQYMKKKLEFSFQSLIINLKIHWSSTNLIWKLFKVFWSALSMTNNDKQWNCNHLLCHTSNVVFFCWE